MTRNLAFHIVRESALDATSAWWQILAGRDPGANRVLELRTALRVAWRELKDQEELPRAVVRGAGTILAKAREAENNLRNSTEPVRAELIEDELPDLIAGAFDLLVGAPAETWTVRRPDLGE